MTWDLRLGDCLEGLRAMPDKSVDHVITDPPYNIEGVKGGLRQTPNGGIRKERFDYEAMTDHLMSAIALEIARVCRRWAVVFCQVEDAVKWRDCLETGGLTRRRICAWYKPDGQPQITGDRPGTGFEAIVVCHAMGSGKSRWNAGGRLGVWKCNTFKSTKDRIRQGQKPLALMEELIRDFTDPGELICDPFAGGATTGVACIRLGRDFVGWEKDEPTYHRARARLENTREQRSLFSTPQGAKCKHKQETLQIE